MAAQVISLSMRRTAAPPAPADWSQREIAEFYRVESALLQAGMRLESERGVSDEGDPWFAFCHADTGEVFIHFARENGRYVVDGGPFGAAARGDDFAALVRELIGRHPLAAARRPGSNVMLHPAALLIALVGACFFHAVQAKAAETPEGAAAKAAVEHARRSAITLANGDAPQAPVEAGGPAVVALDAVQAATLLAAIAIGLREPTPSASSSPATVVAAPIGPAPLDGAAPAGRAALADMARADSAAFSHAEQSAAALSVVAVLHDLFRIQTAAAAPTAAAPVATVGEGAAPLASTTPTAPVAPTAEHVAPPAAASDRALLVVHLGAGELPHLEAVAIVQGLGALKLLSLDHIDRVDHLPGYILNAIAQGEQVDVTHADGFAAPISATPIPDALDHSGQALAPGHVVELTPAPRGDDHGGGGGGSSGSSGGGAPSSGGTAPLPDLAPVHTDPAPTPALSDPAPVTVETPTPVPTPAPDGQSALVSSAVLKFTTLVGGHPGVIVAGHEVVLYDPQIYAADFKAQPLDSVTFTFNDGSTLSLVGTAAELHDLHGLH